MDKTFGVKNVKIGEGIPKICVPLIGVTEQELLEEIERVKEVKLDIVEWRVDFYEHVENIEKVKYMLNKILMNLGEIPIIFTFRSKKEGGEREIPNEYYIKLNCEIAKTKLVDIIDVELFTGENYVKEVLKTAHENKVKVIISNHDFLKTPNKKEIISRLTQMIKLNADIPKIAVMPQTQEDVLTLLCATNEMKNNYPKQPIITMSMAGIGVISRISGELFGSCITFGCVKNASAPGQMLVEDLYSVLKLLHKSK